MHGTQALKKKKKIFPWNTNFSAKFSEYVRNLERRVERFCVFYESPKSL